MKNETSDTTMLAVTVIFLAVVVALGFGIFQYARSSLNGGIDRLTRTFDTVNVAEYADYDQKTITGNKVTSALQGFEGTECAILIGTKALQTTSGKISQSKTSADEVPTVWQIEIDENNKPYVINYNALIDLGGDGGATAGATGNGDSGATSISSDIDFTMTDGVWVCSAPFVSKNGVVQYYLVKRDYITTGMTEYISSGSRFTSNLIKDISGTIMGMCFIQQ